MRFAFCEEFSILQTRLRAKMCRNKTLWRRFRDDCGESGAGLPLRIIPARTASGAGEFRLLVAAANHPVPRSDRAMSAELLDPEIRLLNESGATVARSAGTELALFEPKAQHIEQASGARVERFEQGLFFERGEIEVET